MPGHAENEKSTPVSVAKHLRKPTPASTQPCTQHAGVREHVPPSESSSLHGNCFADPAPVGAVRPRPQKACPAWLVIIQCNKPALPGHKHTYVHVTTVLLLFLAEVVRECRRLPFSHPRVDERGRATRLRNNLVFVIKSFTSPELSSSEISRTRRDVLVPSPIATTVS